MLQLGTVERVARTCHFSSDLAPLRKHVNHDFFAFV
jgi:hypothetical protein